MRRWVPVLSVLVLLTGATSVVRAQGGGDRPANEFQFRVGGFFPRGGGDIWDGNEAVFTMDRSDFDGVTWGMSFLLAMNNKLELGLNIDFYEETARSAERFYYAVDPDGFQTSILHDTRLQLIPATVDLRFLPTGRYGVRGSAGQRRVLHPVPYIGGGIGMNYWEYEEVGDFVDPATSDIYSTRSIESGPAFEAHVLAGVELPIGARSSVIFEGRYSWSSTTPNGDFAGFGSLDLSGFSGSVGFGYRF